MRADLASARFAASHSPPPFNVFTHLTRIKLWLGSQSVQGCILVIEKGNHGYHLKHCSVIKNTVQL